MAPAGRFAYCALAGVGDNEQERCRRVDEAAGYIRYSCLFQRPVLRGPVAG